MFTLDQDYLPKNIKVYIKDSDNINPRNQRIVPFNFPIETD